jgi:uncharacterized membrane protein YfcA
MDDWLIYSLLCLSAFLAGAINAVAGGGTLLTFPALTAVIDPVAANATSTIALMPGSMASSFGYRKELRQTRRILLWLLVPSIIGGALGAWMVLLFSKSVFEKLVPWLILLATLLFLLQPRIASWLGTHPHHEPHGRTIIVILVAQFFIALYGGYFGAGIGILMLSTLAFMSIGDIHHTNAVKTLLASIINACAVAIFLMQGTVVWQYAWPMVITSILGGYYGAMLARRMKREHIRRTVIIIGFIVSAIYFFKQWGWL